MNRIVLVLFISLVFSNEDAKYTFINKYNNEKKLKSKQDFLMFFEIPGLGEYRNGNNYTSIKEYLGKKDGFEVFQLRVTGLVSTSVFGDKVNMNHNLQAINNVPCRLYINNDGEIDHIETAEDEHSFLLEELEAHYMDMNMENFSYPFGKDAENISVGDSWTEVTDSISFTSVDNMEGLMSDSTVYTLNKVKTKKGVEYISAESVIACENIIFLGTEIMEVHMGGTFESSYKYDIMAGEIISENTTGNLLGIYEFLDTSFKSPISYAITSKRVK